MINYSCVHCGKRMKITEDAGSKKARCPKCGSVVTLAGAKAAKRKSASRTRPGERTTSHPPVPEATHLTPAPAGRAPGSPRVAGEETGSSPPIHELPTRSESVPEMDHRLTSFLLPPLSSDELGRLGKYRVLEIIGAGGMGVVFKAEDPRLRRQVALKAMLPALAASPTARERFLREAQAAAAIQHDRVVAVYDVGEDNGVPYLAMPFLRGRSLEARLREAGGPLPTEEILRIGQEIAEGLAAIHDLGLIHRDVKPGNIWLEGDAGRVKILDFGLARAARADVQLTQEGSILGSPAYMAPEQASRKPIDPRTDLFSLGCVLYLMATGALPFEGDDALSTLLAVTSADPELPQKRNPAVPAGVSQLVMALLAKKPDDRPGSAREVIEAIEKLKE
jgi:serine/threonine protein kinase/DNA-directed RNA polymerase subunit RPC12/RpoP